MSLLEINHMKKSFGEVEVLKDISMKAKVHPERIPKLIEDFRGELTFKADGVQPCFIYEKKRRNLKEKQTDALESTKNVLNGLKRLIGEEKSGIIDPLSK